MILSKCSMKCNIKTDVKRWGKTRFKPGNPLDPWFNKIQQRQ